MSLEPLDRNADSPCEVFASENGCLVSLKLGWWSEIESCVSDLLLHCVHLFMGSLEVAAAHESLLRDAQSNNN